MLIPFIVLFLFWLFWRYVHGLFFFFAIIGREALGVDVQQMAYLRIKILLFMGVPLRIACSCI